MSTARTLMAKKRIPVKVEWAASIEPCRCGSGLTGNLERNGHGIPVGYMCVECRERRLPTFGIDPSNPRAPVSAAAIFVIQNCEDPEQYWCGEFGWVVEAAAEEFSSNDWKLPENGRWVQR